MLKALLVLLLVAVSLSAVLKFRADIAHFFTDDIKTAEIEGPASPETYVGMIVHDDAEMKAIAAELSSSCKANDSACVFYKLYTWVQGNFRYVDDLAGLNIISGVSVTLSRKGGDCEDLSILLASLLENVGISTKLALQEDHVYVYACGVQKEGILRMMKQDKRFTGYVITGDLIEEYNIDGAICIPADPSVRGELVYPGVRPSGEDRFIVTPEAP